ncbi:MAG: nuclear transport factor 2 family protein [Acidobacteriota bacterium]
MIKAIIVAIGVALSLEGARTSAALALDVEAEKAAVARAVDASIGWFAAKDFELLFRTIADDADLFFFSPDSRGTVRGIESFRENSAIWRDPGSKYLSHEIRDLRVHLHPSGEVAWFSAILDDCGEYDGRKACWLDTRWTGVLEKRAGAWVMMQMHFSFASDHVRERVEKRVREELAASAPKP